MTSDQSLPATSVTRRRFLRDSALLLSFSVCGKMVLATPQQASKRQYPLTTLTDAEASTLAALSEALVPGSRAAGIIHFIDQQLSAPAADNLLMIKYLGFPPSAQVDYYRAALANVTTLGRQQFNAPVESLGTDQLNALVTALASDQTPGWEGPPASLFFFVLRSDAVDVTYGTNQGIEQLNMPLMTHIEAPRPW